MDTATVSSTQSKSLLRYVPAVFMLLFLAGGLVMSFFSPVLFKSPNKKFLNGEWSAAYEAEFNKSLAIRQPSIDGWGVLEYTLFGNGRDGVIVGDDGWLFTGEEFKFYAAGDKGVQEKLELAKTAKETLDAQNIKLLVVLIPSKARIYSNKLGRYSFPGYNQNLYDTFAEELENLGIPVVKLAGSFETAKVQQDVFLKTDTHWTLYGATLAAQETANVVNERQLLPSFNSATFTTVSAQTPTLHKGDLLTYLPLGAFQERLGPAFDSISEATTGSEDAGGGLFGSSTIPVALVGTSYSANALWNFAGALKEALGADVLNVANEGEGPTVPMLEYLSSDALRDTPPELVIWEIPERFVRVAYE
jgi:alginate O-acetyltransferase complex protein AlgJ